MGYILPVPNYQAQHYQERVSQLPTDPIPIERIYPKKIEMSYYAAPNNQMLANDHNQNQSKQDPKIDQQSTISEKVDQDFANLTGIGGQINYSI